MYRYLAECKQRILSAGILPALGGHGLIEQNADELAWFCAWCRALGVKTWLEIGTSRGGLMGFVERELGVGAVGVNLFAPDQPVRGRAMVGDSHTEAVRAEIAKLGPFDAVFIDGDHSGPGVAQDAAWYGPLATKILAFHDTLGRRGCEPVRTFWEASRGGGDGRLNAPAWVEFAEAGEFGVGIGAIVREAGVSVILPHLRSAINDAALALAQPSWSHDPGLVADVQILDGPEDPYALWNEYVPQANTNTILFTNSDVVLADDWLRVALPHARRGRVVFGVLVEPGAMGVAPQNVTRDFGMCPRCCRLDAFAAWARSHRTARPDLVTQQGWPMPCLMDKRDFIAAGMFPADVPFMYRPNDLMLLERMRAQGIEMVTVPAFAYHFQNLSRRRNVCGCYAQVSTRPV